VLTPTTEHLELAQLPDGRHTLHVFSVDDAGNRERRPLVYTWTVSVVSHALLFHPFSTLAPLAHGCTRA
jgi:hypothetical protein